MIQGVAELVFLGIILSDYKASDRRIMAGPAYSNGQSRCSVKSVSK